jgi:hypothetical protein
MRKNPELIIDMTPEGRILGPQPVSLGTIMARLAAFGVGLFVLAIAFWAALFLLPVMLILGVLGYFALRGQLQRGGFEIRRRY